MHGVCGSFGVLAVGLFANGTYGSGWNGTKTGVVAEAGAGLTGVFGDLDNIGFGLRQLASQAIGVLVLWTVIFGIAFTFFKIQSKVMKGGIRPTAEVETSGMDIEMGVMAYPEFALVASGAPSTPLEPPAPAPVMSELS